MTEKERKQKAKIEETAQVAELMKMYQKLTSK